jgi:hypothetical protein
LHQRDGDSAQKQYVDETASAEDDSQQPDDEQRERNEPDYQNEFLTRRTMDD